MKTHNLLPKILLISVLAAGSALAIPDSVPPTLTISTPPLGVAQTTNSIVVSGSATDTVQAAPTETTVRPAEIIRVEYRLSGNRKWKKAILIPGSSIATVAWVFTINLPKGQHTMVSVRAVDGSSNESDIITRQVKRTRTTR